MQKQLLRSLQLFRSYLELFETLFRHLLFSKIHFLQLIHFRLFSVLI